MSFPNAPHMERRRAANPQNLDPKGWLLKLIFSRVGPGIKAAVSAALGGLIGWQGPNPPSGFYGSKLTTEYLQ